MHQKIQTALDQMSKLEEALIEDTESKPQFPAASFAIFLKG